MTHSLFCAPKQTRTETGKQQDELVVFSRCTRSIVVVVVVAVSVHTIYRIRVIPNSTDRSALKRWGVISQRSLKFLAALCSILADVSHIYTTSRAENNVAPKELPPKRAVPVPVVWVTDTTTTGTSIGTTSSSSYKIKFLYIYIYSVFYYPFPQSIYEALEM